MCAREVSLSDLGRIQVTIFKLRAGHNSVDHSSGSSSGNGVTSACSDFRESGVKERFGGQPYQVLASMIFQLRKKSGLKTLFENRKLWRCSMMSGEGTKPLVLMV